MDKVSMDTGREGDLETQEGHLSRETPELGPPAQGLALQTSSQLTRASHCTSECHGNAQPWDGDRQQGKARAARGGCRVLGHEGPCCYE